MDMSPPASTSPDRPRIRKEHRKSRNGCNICKRRKIKCDERKPGCANCEKHGVECEFPRTVAPSLRTAHAASAPDLTAYQSPGESTHSANLQDRSAPTPGNVFQEFSAAQGSSGRIASLELIHLELLHNYTTLTSQTLSDDPVLKNVWRINVPQVGFEFDYVMRSIFAVSALHIALFAADKREYYMNVARSEHGAALREITAMLSNVTAENCSAIYISAALTFFYAWASPRQPGDFFLLSPSGVADWLLLLRGVRTIIQTWSHELGKGPFSPMFRLGSMRLGELAAEHQTSAAWRSTAECAQLANLRRVVKRAAANARTANTYEENIGHLELCFCAILGASHERAGDTLDPHLSSGSSYRTFLTMGGTSNVYSWLYRMSDHFIELLIQRDALALVIFAHFCVLFKFMGSFWWMQGWATHLMQEIWDLLDEEHRLWIRWPVEELGWRSKT